MAKFRIRKRTFKRLISAVLVTVLVASLGGALISVDKFALNSDSDIDTRVIISVAKLSPTPSKYPRHYSQIVKKHL